MSIIVISVSKKIDHLKFDEKNHKNGNLLI